MAVSVSLGLEAQLVPGMWELTSDGCLLEFIHLCVSSLECFDLSQPQHSHLPGQIDDFQISRIETQIVLTLLNKIFGLGKWTMGKVPAAQAFRPEFRLPAIVQKVKCSVTCNPSAKTSLEDPGGSLAWQSSQLVSTKIRWGATGEDS